MLNTLSQAEAASLRETFAEAAYRQESFVQRPALKDLYSSEGALSALLARTEEPSPLNVLLRLFSAGVPVARDVVASSFAAPIVEIMLRSGLVIEQENTLRGAVMITPVDSDLIASDPPARMESGLTGDLVLWPNPTTRLLQWFAIQEPCSAILDLGTGCGVLAVRASRYSVHVCATDLNPRALDFARFNMWINGVSTVECLSGDTFEPVKGRLFDRILANPPFFVTPSSQQLYCENPMELDSYCRRVVRESPRLLREGGYLQMVFEWVQVRGQAWQERLATWFEDTGCDAWVLRGYARDAISYARERTRKDVARSQSLAESRFDKFLEYYRSRRVEEVHGGVLCLRRRLGNNWVRIEEMPVDPTAPVGEQVLETFATQDTLTSHPADPQLLDTRPLLAPDTRLHQILRIGNHGWETAEVVLRRTRGVPASMPIELAVAEFLGRCDGRRTLRELSAELGRRVEAPLESVEQQCCAAVRKLAENRLVLLA